MVPAAPGRSAARFHLRLRHNSPDTSSGGIRESRWPRRATKRASSTRSRTRRAARAVPRTTSGSGATRSVHCTGTAHTVSSSIASNSRRPAALQRSPTHTNGWPRWGWNGCVIWTRRFADPATPAFCLAVQAPGAGALRVSVARRRGARRAADDERAAAVSRRQCARRPRRALAGAVCRRRRAKRSCSRARRDDVVRVCSGSMTIRDPEMLRQVAVLLERENDRLHAKLTALTRELSQLRGEDARAAQRQLDALQGDPGPARARPLRRLVGEAARSRRPRRRPPPRAAAGPRPEGPARAADHRHGARARRVGPHVPAPAAACCAR